MEFTELKNLNRGYMKLDVWQKAIVLFQLICRTVIKDFPIDFKLRSQVIDSAQSVSANIAEGYSRRSVKEYLQYLYIALGSLSETLTRCIGLKTTN
jgi:four helix bundle protein